MSYTKRQMLKVLAALRAQHEIWLDRVVVSCSTEIAADVVMHLRSVKLGYFHAFRRTCVPCRLLLEHAELFR